MSSVKRNIAVVGCGYWGKNLVRNFAELEALHTICDADPQKLTSFKSAYPWANTETDYLRMLQNEEIKGVVISTPAALHYEMARQALLADKDVFVEKPFTTDSRDAEKLVSLSVKQERIIMVGHLLLYHPAVQMLKQYIQSGELGEIYYLYSTRVNLGQIRQDENALWRLVPHDIAVFVYLVDSPPVTISAQGACYLRSNLEDIVFVTLKLGGVLAHIHASWLDPHKIRQFTVVGNRKMAVFDDMEPKSKLKIWDKGVIANHGSNPSGSLTLRSGEAYTPEVEFAEPLLLECQEFIRCIGERCQPLSDAKLGLTVVETLEALQQLLEVSRQ